MSSAALKVPADQMTRRRFFLFDDRSAGLSKGKSLLFWLWNLLCLLVSSFGLCVVTLLLAYGAYSPEVFWDYFSKPLLLLLNLLPILLLQLFLYACTGRQWIAFLVTSLIFVIGAVSNYYKLTLRGDPVVFSDISSMFTAAGFAGKYDIRIGKRVILAVCSVPLGTVFLFLFARGRLAWQGRLAAGLAVAVSLVPLWTQVYSQKRVFNSPGMKNDAHINQWSDTQQMISRGFVYSLVNSATKTFEPVPEGYSAQDVQTELAAFTDGVIPEEKKVNILGLQLEAFADFETLGISDIDPAVYADYHTLKAESYSGRLITNIFAGGTIDTERCFLTGSSVLHYYGKNTPSYAWYLKSQGYQTTGSHPCTWEFYNRRSINSYLGFDTYYYMENCYNQFSEWTTADDDILFPELLRKFTAAMEEGPVFDFTVTYQGHGPYDTGKLKNDEVLWDGTDCSEEAYYALNNYLSSVKNTSAHLLELTRELQKSDKPVVVILFGDHKPWMGNDASVYHELGVSFDLATEQGVTDYYGTEYLIWANDAAKKVTGFDFIGEAPTTSSGYLMNILFNTLGWKGPAYMQFTEQVRQTLPVITSTGVWFNGDGMTHTLTEQEQDALSRLLCVQYYRHRHFGEIS